MRVLKKILNVNWNKKVGFICIIILIIFTNRLIHAESMNINSASTYINNDIFYLNSSSEFYLSKEAYKALQQGISFEIHTDFQLLLKRKWFWNKIIFEKKIIHKLEHKPLTENFLITNMNTGIVNYYKNIDSAINAISKVSKMRLFKQSKLQKNTNYLARIRLHLDIDSLPSPLRPRAYFSSDWNISSQWYKWEI